MNPIQRYCGINAWQVIFRVLKDTTQTLMPNCYFKNLNIINDQNVLHSNFNKSVKNNHNNNKLNDEFTKNNWQHQYHHRKQVYYSTNYPIFYNNNNNWLHEKTLISPKQQQQKLKQNDFKQQKNTESPKNIGNLSLFFLIINYNL